MTSHSKTKAQFIIERLKRTLLKYDLEIERVKGEINLYSEKMDLLYGTTKKSELKDFVSSKIYKENYETYLKRLKTAKLAIVARINLVVNKYEPNHAKVFQMRYFEGKNVEEISTELNIPVYKVRQMVRRLDEDVTEYVGAKQKK